jgi:uncharacterized membrane protein YgcG
LLDRPLRALIATAWERLAEVGDSSPYVADVARILRATMPLLRARLADAAFRNLCDKFAKAFIARYQAAIFKCARIGEFGAQQMLLDAQGMRSILLAAPTMRGPAGDGAGAGAGAGAHADDDDDIRSAISGASGTLGKDGGGGGGGGAGGAGAPALNEDGTPMVAPAIYTKTVTREMPRIEMLFKIIAAPKDRFADTCVAWRRAGGGGGRRQRERARATRLAPFPPSTAAPRFARATRSIKALWPEVSAAELGRVMELKNLSKKDQGDIFAQLGFAKPAQPAASMASMVGVVAGLAAGGDHHRGGSAASGGGAGGGGGAAAAGSAAAGTASAVASSLKESGLKTMAKLFGSGSSGSAKTSGNPFK